VICHTQAKSCTPLKENRRNILERTAIRHNGQGLIPHKRGKKLEKICRNTSREGFHKREGKKPDSMTLKGRSIRTTRSRRNRLFRYIEFGGVSHGPQVSSGLQQREGGDIREGKLVCQLSISFERLRFGGGGGGGGGGGVVEEVVVGLSWWGSV